MSWHVPFLAGYMYISGHLYRCVVIYAHEGMRDALILHQTELLEAP